MMTSSPPAGSKPDALSDAVTTKLPGGTLSPGGPAAGPVTVPVGAVKSAPNCAPTTPPGARLKQVMLPSASLMMIRTRKDRLTVVSASCEPVVIAVRPVVLQPEGRAAPSAVAKNCTVIASTPSSTSVPVVSRLSVASDGTPSKAFPAANEVVALTQTPVIRGWVMAVWRIPLAEFTPGAVLSTRMVVSAGMVVLPGGGLLALRIAFGTFSAVPLLSTAVPIGSGSPVTGDR